MCIKWCQDLEVIVAFVDGAPALLELSGAPCCQQVVRFRL